MHFALAIRRYSMDKTKVKLRICDIDCTITSDDNEEYVRTIGDEIDRAISAVLKKNDRISLSMAAIITAMTYCDESAKAKAELAELKTLDKNRSNEYERLKQAAETAQTEAEQLRSELQVLHAFLTEDKDLEKMPGFKNALDTANQNLSPGQNRDSSDANNASEDTSTPSQETQEQETNETPAPASVEDAHTLEELRNSIDTEEIDQIVDNPLQGVPPAVNKSQTKHSKQSRHQKKQQKMAQKAAEKEGPRHIPPYSPVQRAEHPVPDLLTGSYTRPKSPIEPELPSDDTFIGYFDKQ